MKNTTEMKNSLEVLKRRSTEVEHISRDYVIEKQIRKRTRKN